MSPMGVRRRWPRVDRPYFDRLVGGRHYPDRLKLDRPVYLSILCAKKIKKDGARVTIFCPYLRKSQLFKLFAIYKL